MGCPVRILVYIGVLVGTSMIGALNTSIGFAWVCMVNGSNETDGQTASAYERLNWGNHEQGIIFAFTGVGGLLFALPSGWLITRFGTRVTVSTTLTVCGLASMLIPAAGQWHYLCVAVLWAVVSSSSAFFFPMAFNVCSYWAVKSEMGKALAFSTCGMQIGRFCQILLGGIQCRYIGWEWIFYITGMLSIAFSITWYILYRDEPGDCRFVTQKELQYITENRQRKKTKEKVVVPWLAIFLSVPVWSCMVCRFTVISITRGINQFIPTYVRDIIKLRPEINGYVSSVPIVAQLVGRFAAGAAADLKYGTITFRMKIINTIALVGTALFCIALAHVQPTDHAAVSITYFCGVMLMVTVATGGYMKAPLHMAPQYSAIIGSFLNVAGNIAAMTIPLMVDGIVIHKTAEEWAIVFYIIMGISLMGAISFLIFGSGRKLKFAEESERSDSPKEAVDQLIPLKNGNVT